MRISNYEYQVTLLLWTKTSTSFISEQYLSFRDWHMFLNMKPISNTTLNSIYYSSFISQAKSSSNFRVISFSLWDLAQPSPQLCRIRCLSLQQSQLLLSTVYIIYTSYISIFQRYVWWLSLEIRNLLKPSATASVSSQTSAPPWSHHFQLYHELLMKTILISTFLIRLQVIQQEHDSYFDILQILTLYGLASGLPGQFDVKASLLDIPELY